MPASGSAPVIAAKHYAQVLDVAVAQWSAPDLEQDLERDEEGLPIYTLAQLRAAAAHQDQAEEGRQRAHRAMHRMHLAQRKAQAHAAKVNACQQPLSQRAARRTQRATRYTQQLREELRHRSGRPAPPEEHAYMCALAAACSRADQLAQRATQRMAAATAVEHRTQQRQLVLISQRHMTHAERLQLLHAPNRSEAYTPVHPCQVGVMGSVQAQNAPPGAALQINKEHRLIP